MDAKKNILDKIREKFNAITKQITIIFLYFLIVLMLQVICEKDILSDNIWLSNISNIFIQVAYLTTFIFIFRKNIVPDFYDFKKNGKTYIKNNWIYWFIGLVIMVISNYIISSFIGMASNEEVNQNILQKMPIYSTIVTVIIAPITEELMTRVYLKDLFKNPTLYIILSGLIFGSLHLLTATSTSEIFFLIPYGVLGSIFAFMYHKTNNVWTNIFFHSFHNFLALALTFIGA